MNMNMLYSKGNFDEIYANKIYLGKNKSYMYKAGAGYFWETTNEILRITEFKRYLLVDFNGCTGLFIKKCVMPDIYSSAKFAEYSGSRYKMTRDWNGIYKFVAQTGNIKTNVDMKITKYEFENKGIKQFIVEHLRDINEKYDPDLLDLGTVIYRKYKEPLRINRECLCDLVISFVGY